MSEFRTKTGERRDGADPAFGERARALRASFGETLDAFAERLSAHGWKVGKAEVSRIERARMYKAWAAVDAYAAIDPERRGRVYWGWGVEHDELRDEPRA